MPFHCGWLAAVACALAANAESPPGFSDVRALWKVDAPLFEALVSTGRPGLSQQGALMWGHLVNPAQMTPWALRHGVPYSLDEALRLHGQHKLHIVTWPSGILPRLDVYRQWHAKYGVKLTLTAFAYTKREEEKEIYLLDPQFTDECLRLTGEVLAKAGNLIAFVFTGDEQYEQALRGGVELFEKDREKMKNVDREVREQFGFGKYGMPTSLKDNNPFRRWAYARWTSERMLERQRRLHDLVRKSNPKLPIVGCDAMTGIKPFEYVRQAPWVDIFTGQNWIGEQLNRSVEAVCAAKIIADTTGREVWPCSHINRIGAENRPGPEELREFYSALFIHGVTGFHVYTPDNLLAGKAGDTRTFFFGDPERWRALLEIVDRTRNLPPLKRPEPDFAVLFSNDAHQATAQPGSGDGRYAASAFALLSPVAKAWFRFLDETNLAETKPADLTRYKAIVVPFAKYSRKDVPERLLAYAKAGGTVVCSDAEAFSSDLDGTDTRKLREQLLGVILKETRGPMKTELNLKPSPLWPDFGASQTLPVAGTAFRIEPNVGTEVLATFADGSPAIMVAKVGNGRVISFALNPFLLEPFTAVRGRLSDAVFHPAWLSFWRAFLRGLGIQLDHDIHRFRFPPFERVHETPPASQCLTGNYVEWKRDKPTTPHNANIAGTYRFSLVPDGLADAATDNIGFHDGKLTDRVRATKDEATVSFKDRIVQWNTSKPFDLTFTFGQPCRFEKIVMICSGAPLETSVTCDGKSVLATIPSRAATEDVVKLPLTFSKPPVAKSLTLHFGSRLAGKNLTLAEVEIWGRPEP